MRRDLGDFQTPPQLVRAVLATLGRVGDQWPRVLEPTCGRGNFLDGLLHAECPPAEIIGLELQDSYAQCAASLAPASQHTSVTVRCCDVFGADLRYSLDWSTNGPLLVVGNPPWITNSTLGSLGSGNLPTKTNLGGARGIDALTGQSNFDIAEAIWIQIIRQLAPLQPTIAMLSKTAVARNVLRFMHDEHLPLRHATIYLIEAKRWFNAAVDACLFRMDMGGSSSNYQAAVYRSLDAGDPDSIIGFRNGRIVADVLAYDESGAIDGACQLEWRQGIKHDAANVMELVVTPNGFVNGLGEVVDVEAGYLYPLLKGSALYRGSDVTKRAVVVTQRKLSDSTTRLRETAPRLWSYLSAHCNELAARHSRVYRGKGPFAMFGVGDYTFAPYKVAVSGLHKLPIFRVLGCSGGRPMVLDDTCYFLPCQTAAQAGFITALLNGAECRRFLNSLLFADAKRPVTKKLLKRIDLHALLARCSRSELLTAAERELSNGIGDLLDPRPWPDDLTALLTDGPARLL